jgi:hypothetical protein
MFHGRPRFDSVCLNTADARFGRLEGLFRCHLPSGRIQDIILVQAMKNSKWKPRTFWDGCTVLEKAGPMFIAPQYVVRGAVLADTDLEKLSGERWTVEDTADGDMFLRMGN